MWATATPCRGDRHTARSVVSHPAHTQAVGIWTLAARPPGPGSLECLACLARYPVGFGQSCPVWGRACGLSESPPRPRAPRTRSPHEARRVARKAGPSDQQTRDTSAQTERACSVSTRLCRQHGLRHGIAEGRAGNLQRPSSSLVEGREGLPAASCWG